MTNQRVDLFLRKTLFFLTITATVGYITWRMFFTLPLSFGIFSIVAGILLLVAEILSAIQAIDKYSGLSKNAEPELPVIPDSWFPDVDVFIATHSESRDLLYKTINACTFMLYPDKSRVHIFVCDDNDRPEIAALASELNVGYFGLSGNKLYKAGNLNNAMSKTKSPLVVTLDADMIPTRDLLLKSVPYFFLPKVKKLDSGAWVEREAKEIDPGYRIGFIQTPQSFYNADLFQFNLFSENRIPNEQDYFFREVNVNRNSSNAPIYAGTNTIISRKALEEVGYIATGTITEDFATGLSIQQKGWTTYAISEPLAHGLAPVTIDGLLNQRERWGRGCVQSLQKAKLLIAKGMPWKTKISYLNCYFYWWTFMARFIFIFSPILFAVFRLRIVICSWWEFFLFWLPYYLLYGISLKLTSGLTRNQHWNSVIDTILFPYIAGPVLFEALGFKLDKFVVTNKDKNFDGKSTWPFALPHILLLLASIVSLALITNMTLKQATLYNFIIIFWLIVNSKNLLLAIFFMCGRQNIRQTERFYVKLPLEIRTDREIFTGRTLDISENGLALELDRPEYIDPDRDFDIIITSEPYVAAVRARIIHVENRNDVSWKYCVYITGIDQANKRQYYQIIYDRHHSMPDKIADNWSMFDDYSLNLSKRTETVVSVQRKLPRIDMSVPLAFHSGKQGTIRNFNYRYMSLAFGDDQNETAPIEPVESTEIVFDACPDFVFILKLVSSQPEKGIGLYFIENWAELMELPGLRELVDLWIARTPNAAVEREERYERVFA